MTGVVMRMLSDALGRPSPEDGQYLKDCDFEANNGFGVVTFTPDIAEAKRFADLVEMHRFYKTQPACHPIRMTDGRPNRPLTGWNWTIDNIEDA